MKGNVNLLAALVLIVAFFFVVAQGVNLGPANVWLSDNFATVDMSGQQYTITFTGFPRDTFTPDANDHIVVHGSYYARTSESDCVLLKGSWTGSSCRLNNIFAKPADNLDRMVDNYGNVYTSFTSYSSAKFEINQNYGYFPDVMTFYLTYGASPPPVTPPPAPVAECGNGILEIGEGCDDGNTISGDGCSASCVVEPPSTTPPPQQPRNIFELIIQTIMELIRNFLGVFGL